MAVHETLRLYRFFDSRGRYICEVVALTYDEAYERAVAVAGSRLPFSPDFQIETLEEEREAD